MLQIIPLPRLQHQMIDWMALMHRQHTMHALVEVDVTAARRILRASRAAAPASFTAFLVSSLARAVAADPRMHAYRQGRSRLVLFEDVDVGVMVEREVEGERIPVGVVIRGAERKFPAEIHREIRDAQTGLLPWARVVRWLPLWLAVPAFIRRMVLAAYMRDPSRRKRLAGTVVLTSVGMFGRGSGWGVALTGHTLSLTVGGIARKPWVVRAADGEEQVEVRDILSLTISLDHDVVDGAPAARFAARLKELIEAAAVLEERQAEVAGVRA